MKLIRRIVGVAAAAALSAGGVLAATPLTASAYDPGVWDKVANCESTNRWDINTGNGFYGGLQFTKSTWLGFGGGTYAPYAHKASKAEQIAVARRVLAVQGPGAWPVCSQKAGLTKANGGADRDAKPGQGGGTTDSGGSQNDDSNKGGSTSDRTVTVKSGDTLYAIAQRYRVAGGYKALARANNISNPAQIRVGQRLTIPCSGSGCTTAPAPSKPPAKKKDDTPPASGRSVTVKAGDTLYALAQRYDVSGGYMALARANNLSNPAMIRIGQKIVLP